jgi:hydroxymethylpyrimidine pyrophosphatase-like HAD family hydrolase
MENLKTIFLDIDGTLIYHHGIPNGQTKYSPLVLDDVLKKLGEWNVKGYYIVLVTGRRESERPATIKQLEEAGIVYDLLITGISRGQRVLINDLKSDSDTPTAIAINLERNKGLSDVSL